MIYQLPVPYPVQDVEEMRVLEWHGETGHVFAPGDLVVELETHKAIVEVRSKHRGVLRAILCEAGGWEKAGKCLAVLSDEPDEPVTGAHDTLAPWLVEFEVI